MVEIVVVPLEEDWESTAAMMFNHATMAHNPSFSRIWLDPVPTCISIKPQNADVITEMEWGMGVEGGCTERLLTTDGKFIRIKQITEKLPTSRNLINLQPQLPRHQIQRPARRHTPRQPKHPILPEIRNRLSMMCNHRNGIRGRNECVMAVNHVSVSVAVGGSAKGNLLGVDAFDEGVGVG